MHGGSGGFVELDKDMVQLQVEEGWTRWVPLLQVDTIDLVELETANRLPRPRVEGIVEAVVRRSTRAD